MHVLFPLLMHQKFMSSSFSIKRRPTAEGAHMRRPKIALLGPARQAVSGVSTHLDQLVHSDLPTVVDLLHFQVGSEGRNAESPARLLTRLLVSPLTFAAFCLRHRPDVIHLNTSLEPRSYWRDLVYLAIAKVLRCKVVYQVHGGALPLEFVGGRRHSSAVLSKALNWADVVVLLARIEYEAYRSFAPRARLQVIPNAVEVADAYMGELDEKPAGPLRLAYVGRLAENKGVIEALEAFALLVHDGRHMSLTFAGSGPMEPWLRKRVLELGVSDVVHFAGPLFGKAKDALWQEVHVFAFPTYHREGLPYALLEAMAAGAVPVTTRVGAIPDVVTDGVEGFFVKAKEPTELAAALRNLDDDREMLARMARAGRARVVANYTVARLASDFRRLYFDLVGER